MFVAYRESTAYLFDEGMKGSLKTSLGKLLAEALRYYYFDRYLFILR